MADAIPVAPQEPQAAPKGKKGAAAALPADVQAELKGQPKAAPQAVSADSTYKVSGGVALETHQAKREDF